MMPFAHAHDAFRDDAMSSSSGTESGLSDSVSPATHSQLTAGNEVSEQDAKLMLRRRRHRDNMLRYRHKKKATLGEMKTEAAVLSAQLQSMLSLHASQSQSYPLLTQFHHEAHQGALVVRGPGPTAMDEFVNVLVQKEQLQHENIDLRNQLETVERFHQTLRDECEMESDDSMDNASNNRSAQKPRGGRPQLPRKSIAAKQQGGKWISFLDDEPPFYYVPYTEAECHAILRETHANMYRMQLNDLSRRNNVHIMTLFDWTVSLVYEFDEAVQMTMIRYTFRKTFRRSPRRIDELVQSEWDILHDPKLYQNLHRVPVRSKVLQRVNANMSVAMWNAPEPQQSLKYRNVSLFSRSLFENPEGKRCHMIGISAVSLKIPDKDDDFEDETKDESTQERPLAPTITTSTANGELVVYVTGGFLYTLFSQSPENEEGTIDVEFGGYILVMTEAQGRFLMVELGGTCVRLEQLLFPFRVLT
ncbi:hypothetical protein FI667_g7995, partial [Globisporangium splendens]